VPNFRQERNGFCEGAEHLASAETVLEAIKSPEATRMLAILEVACWRIWECPWSEVENLSSEEESEHSWDHVGYSYRL